MKPAWDPFVSQMRQSVHTWEGAALKLPETLTLPSQPNQIPRRSVTQLLSTCLAQMEAVNNSSEVDAIRLAIHQAGIQANIQQVFQSVQHVCANPASQNPQINQQLISSLWGLSTSLAWLAPIASETLERLVADQRLAADSLRILAEADAITAKEQQLSEAFQAANKAQSEIQKLLETIRGHERESGTAKTNAEASASAAGAERTQIEANLKALSEGMQQQQELLTSITALREQAETALIGASRVGLAKAFSDRSKRLGFFQILWASAFAICLVILTVIEAHAIGARDDYVVLFSHSLIALPVIWGAWFAARRYGQIARLTEDYAFKEASALSYDGYRREMGEDTAMRTLLQEAAIRNFAANPVRVLDKHEAASPFQHALELLLKRISPETAAKILSALGQEDKLVR